MGENEAAHAKSLVDTEAAHVKALADTEESFKFSRSRWARCTR
jgi:hypothetical protein